LFFNHAAWVSSDFITPQKRDENDIKALTTVPEALDKNITYLFAFAIESVPTSVMVTNEIGFFFGESLGAFSPETMLSGKYLVV